MKSFISSRGASPEWVCTGNPAAWHAAHTGSYTLSWYGGRSCHIVGTITPRMPGCRATHSTSSTARSATPHQPKASARPLGERAIDAIWDGDSSSARSVTRRSVARWSRRRARARTRVRSFTAPARSGGSMRSAPSPITSTTLAASLSRGITLATAV